MIRSTLKLVGAAAGVAALYGKVLRPWHMNWGADEEDCDRPMLLDDDVDEPTVVTNRAISIDAPPERVWPWLAQMGESPRGGFYSFVFVERLLGMQVQNASMIMPEFQQLEVGQALDRRGTMLVRAVEPGHCLVLGPANNEGQDFQSTWALGVYDDGDGRSRLVSRVRVKYRRWTPMNVLLFLMLDPGQFVMEWKMLREIRRLAEQESRVAVPA